MEIKTAGEIAERLSQIQRHFKDQPVRRLVFPFAAMALPKDTP